MMLTGIHRYVFVIGCLVIKIPRIKLLKCFSVIIRDFSSIYKGSHVSFWWLCRVNCKLILKAYLFEGFKENFREGVCYFCTKNKLLARCYIFLVLVNIYQKKDGVGNFSFQEEDFLHKVDSQIIYEDTFTDYFSNCSHTFDQVNNFAYDTKHVWILDYGERGFKDLLAYSDIIEKMLFSVVKIK